MSAYAGTAFVRVEGDFTRLNRQLAHMSRTSSGVGRAIGAGIRVGLIGAGAAAFTGAKQFSDFQLQMQRLRAEAGASQREVNNMTVAVEKLTKAGKSKFTANELSQGLFYIESHGYRAAKGLKVLRASIDLATAGNADLISTSRALNAVLKSHITPFKDVRKVAGTLNAAVGQGSLRMQDLINALGTGVVPAARTFHLKLGDVTSALAVLTRTGATAQLSATRLRYAFALLGAPSAKAADVFKTIGLKQDSLARDMRKPHGLLVAIKDLRDHLATLPGGSKGVAASQALSRAFGGARSFATISALVQNVGDLSKVYKETSRKAGEFNKDVAAMNNTAANKFHRAWSVINTDLIQLGSKVAPAASKELLSFVRILSGEDPATRKLSFGQRLGKVFETLGGQINQAFKIVGPKIEKWAADEGPKIAAKLVGGFVNASPWTRLFVGGFLISKFIGWGRIFRSTSALIGKQAGEEMSAAMGSSALRGSAATRAAQAVAAPIVPLAGRLKQPQIGNTFISKNAAASLALPGQIGLGSRGPSMTIAGGVAAERFFGGFKTKLGSIGRSAKGFGKALLPLGGGLGATLGLAAAVTFGPTLVQHTSASLSGDSKNFQLPKNNKLFGSQKLGTTVKNLFGGNPFQVDKPKFHVDLGALVDFKHPFKQVLKGQDPSIASQKNIKTFGDNAEKMFNAFTKHRNYGALNNLRDKASDLAKTARSLGKADWADKLQEFSAAAGQAVQPLRVLQNNIGLLRHHAETNLNDLVGLFRQNLSQIPQIADRNTNRFDKLVSQNLGGAISNINKLLHSSVISTRTAMNQIHSVFATTLVQDYGFDPKAAKSYAILKHARGGVVRRRAARGFYMGNPGDNGQDTMPMDLPQGSVVLNRHHQAALGLAGGGMVPTMLGAGELVFGPGSAGELNGLAQSRGYGGLGGLFSRITKPHFMAGGGVVAKGALAGVKSGMANFARLLISKFPLAISSTTGGNHVPGSYHYQGKAVDFSAAPEVMFRAAQWLRGKHASLTEGIHNPNLAVKNGKIFSGAGPFGSVWAGHRDHIHVAIAGAFAAGKLAAAKKLSFRANGRPSLLRGVRQAAGTRATQAANRVLSQAANSSGGDVGPVGKGGAGKKRLEALWVGAGGPPRLANLAAAIALAESGGDPNAHNASGASGLWQILGQLVKGNIFNPVVNAKNAVQKWITAPHGGHNFSPWTTYTGGQYRQYLAKGGTVGKRDPFAKVRAAGKKKSAHQKHGHTKPVKQVPFVPGLDVRLPISAVNLLIGNKGLVPGLQEKYDHWSQVFDQRDQDLNYVVTADPLTGKDLTGAVGTAGGPHLDMDAIKQRVGHLMKLLGYQNQVLAYLRPMVNEKRGMPHLVRVLTKAIAKKNKEIKAIRREIARNVTKLKKLRKELAASIGNGGPDTKKLYHLRSELRHETDKPPKKQNKATIRSLRDEIAAEEFKGSNSAKSAAARRKALRASIHTLEDRNVHLKGHGPHGLKTLTAQVKAFGSAKGTLGDDILSVRGITGEGGLLGDTKITIGQLNQDISDLSTGPGSKLQLQLSQAQPGAPDNSELVSNLQTLLDQANQRTAVSEAQFSAFTSFTNDFPTFGGSFAKGGVVPGAIGEPRMILAHGGERVDPVGSHDHMHISVGDDRIRAYRNGVEQEVTRVTGRQARQAGRRLPGAGGGN